MIARRAALGAFLVVAPIVAWVVVAAGCGNGYDDGIDKDAVKKAQGDLPDIAARSGGNWDKLTPEEQKKFLDRARGNLNTAKFLLGMMSKGGSGAAPGSPPKKP